jgi:hypothetical protein
MDISKYTNIISSLVLLSRVTAIMDGVDRYGGIYESYRMMAAF